MPALMIPSFGHLLKNNQSATAINWLISAIRYSRHEAVMNRSMVTLCPSVNGRTCGGHWQDGIMVFTDHNADARVNGSDERLHRFEYPLEGGTAMRP